MRKELLNFASFDSIATCAWSGKLLVAVVLHVQLEECASSIVEVFIDCGDQTSIYEPDHCYEIELSKLRQSFVKVMKLVDNWKDFGWIEIPRLPNGYIGNVDT